MANSKHSDDDSDNDVTFIDTTPLDKEAKKLICLFEKETKKRVKITAKATQPKEALRNISIVVDSRMIRKLDKKCRIIEAIKENSPSLSVVSDEELPLENSVRWKRHDPTDPNVFHWEADICIVVTADDLGDVIALSGDDGLFLHIAEIRSRVETVSTLRYIVIGLDQFVRQNEKNKGAKTFDLRQIIFETSLRSNVSFHNEPDLANAGRHLAECTKSVAEKLYKKRKQGLNDFLAFAPDLKSVKLDKDEKEESIKLCWRHMIQTAIGSRPNAERAAKVISNVYRCPRQLLDAYSRLNTTKEKETLLELLIADQLAKIKVGPAISAAVYRAFTLQENEVTVDSAKC